MDIEQLREMGYVVLGYDVFDDEDPRRLICRLAHVQQDLNALLNS
jgi:hypothetical protein